MIKFLDTAPLIYIIEGHNDFAHKVIDLISDSMIQEDSFITSVITILEFGVKPEKENRRDILLKFQELLTIIKTDIRKVDIEIATKAYQLRAKYEFLKAMDSIQIATALVSNCEEFITNDRRLKKINEIKVVLIEEQ